MTYVVVGFPGTPTVVSVSGTTGTITATLPAPGVGVLQYINLVGVDLGPLAPAVAFNVNITNLSGGSPQHVITGQTNGSNLLIALNPPYPASATNTAISVNVVLGASTVVCRINIYGYNVPL